MEITSPITCTMEEESLLDMHSVLNVFNVIAGEITLLSYHLGWIDALDRLRERVVDAANQLRDPNLAHKTVEQVEAFITDIDTTLQDALRSRSRNDDVARETRANLASVFDILRVRAREIVARHENPDAWVSHDVAELQTSFTRVLQAIEQNSHGGYRIVYNIAEHEEGNYLVNFQITSATHPTILMPAVFQDVARDLLANARKYTTPGGRINGGLYNTGEELRCVVEDSGIGIPADEISQVVAFGVRGSNLDQRETRGGGFGLTKAYYITRRFGGRMWIESRTSAPSGTRIEIRIPVPE